MLNIGIMSTLFSVFFYRARITSNHPNRNWVGREENLSDYEASAIPLGHRAFGLQ